MDCKYCKIPMVIGEAIKPAIEYGARSIVPTAPIKAKDLKVIAVYKCPQCGHSETID